MQARGGWRQEASRGRGAWLCRQCTRSSKSLHPMPSACALRNSEGGCRQMPGVTGDSSQTVPPTRKCPHHWTCHLLSGTQHPLKSFLPILLTCHLSPWPKHQVNQGPCHSALHPNSRNGTCYTVVLISVCKGLGGLSVSPGSWSSGPEGRAMSPLSWAPGPGPELAHPGGA